MVHILPPLKPHMPIATPGNRIHISPFPHVLFLEDYEYYDNLGRDPLQQNLVWGIKDDVERVEKLKEVLENHPLTKEKHKRSVLATAARRGDEAVARFLVGTGLRVQPRIEDGDGDGMETDGEDEEMKDDDDEEDDDEGSIPDVDDPTVLPLHIAAQNGKLEIIKIFIEEGRVDIDHRAEDGRTTLMVAAYEGNADIVRYLLDQGADISIRGANDVEAIEHLGQLAGGGVIEFAAASGSLECVKLLFERLSGDGKSGVDESAESLITWLAIQSAAGTNYETLRFLLEHGNYSISDLQNNRKLLSDAQRKVVRLAMEPAAESGDLDSLKLLLSYQYPMDGEDKPVGFEPFDELHIALIYGIYNAARQNKIEKLRYLLSFGLKEHSTMSLDDLPEGQLINTQHLFEKAIIGGAVDCANFILEELGAKPDIARIPAGVFPLYNAAIYDKPEMVSFLLDRKVDIHLGSGRFAAGPTALYGAIALKSLGSVELLLKHGGPVDHVDEEITNINKPLTAVLRAESSDGRYEVRLESQANVEQWLEEYRNTCTVLNPPYVLLHLDAEDRTWINQLQRRKRDARLRETGPKARELNAKEAADLDDVLEDDARHLMVDCPSNSEREDQLAEDADLCPAWRPAFVPAG
jgi:ankyrin repeat protein